MRNLRSIRHSRTNRVIYRLPGGDGKCARLDGVDLTGGYLSSSRPFLMNRYLDCLLLSALTTFLAWQAATVVFWNGAPDEVQISAAMAGSVALAPGYLFGWRFSWFLFRSVAAGFLFIVLSALLMGFKLKGGPPLPASVFGMLALVAVCGFVTFAGTKSTVGADWGLSSFRGACLRNADLSSATFTGADFTGADLRGASLGRCDFRLACFDQSDLRDVVFRDCDLRGATFARASLDDARFEHCQTETQPVAS